MDWSDLLTVQGTLKSLLQHHSSKASILWRSAFFIVQLSHPYMTTGKTMALTRWTFVGNRPLATARVCWHRLSTHRKSLSFSFIFVFLYVCYGLDVWSSTNVYAPGAHAHARTHTHTHTHTRIHISLNKWLEKASRNTVTQQLCPPREQNGLKQHLNKCSASLTTSQIIHFPIFGEQTRISRTGPIYK